MNFLHSRLHAGITRDKAATLFDRHPRTIDLWDKGKAPGYAITMMRYLSRDLSYINPAWRGFRFDGDVMITPCKKIVSPGDILSIPYLVQCCQLSRFYDSKT